MSHDSAPPSKKSSLRLIRTPSPLKLLGVNFVQANPEREAAIVEKCF
jgi:hypothetical protein